MSRILTIFVTLFATGCFFPEYESDRELQSAEAARSAPEILMTEADCTAHKNGDAWLFEALVLDADGVDDVAVVRLDVVDSIGLVDQIRFDRVEGDEELWVAGLDHGDTDMRCEDDYDLIFRARDASGEESFIQTAHRPDLSR